MLGTMDVSAVETRCWNAVKATLEGRMGLWEMVFRN